MLTLGGDSVTNLEHGGDLTECPPFKLRPLFNVELVAREAEHLTDREEGELGGERSEKRAKAVPMVESVGVEETAGQAEREMPESASPAAQTAAVRCSGRQARPPWYTSRRKSQRPLSSTRIPPVPCK